MNIAKRNVLHIYTRRFMKDQEMSTSWPWSFCCRFRWPLNPRALGLPCPGCSPALLLLLFSHYAPDRHNDPLPNPGWLLRATAQKCLQVHLWRTRPESAKKAPPEGRTVFSLHPRPKELSDFFYQGRTGGGECKGPHLCCGFQHPSLLGSISARSLRATPSSLESIVFKSKPPPF